MAGLVPLWTLAATLQGTVVGISDGDTITVLDASKTSHKIRLSGIDAPEKKQAFGNISKQSLSDMVYERTVTVEYTKEDRYGRKLGKVLVNGVDANLVQVRMGLAWHYKKYQKEQPPEDRLEYTRAEAKAKEAGRGLWRDGQAVPPWDWRKLGSF
ncbi:thermonuclease family protein [Polaromonas sp. UC242_47]|uniref:thermonuclease family protein n=1 Tax=Polaromonas sp. UC242_47 TaxID=3374626 RepID=UPI0037BCB144